MWRVYLLEFVVVVIVGLLWANGIASMHEKHPDYKGEDFFNEEDNDNLKKRIKMSLSEQKTEIGKPNLHTTLRVLHNLWVDGRLDIFAIDKILRLDHGFMVQHLEPDFIHVESLDGLSTYSLGDCEKYKKQ